MKNWNKRLESQTIKPLNVVWQRKNWKEVRNDKEQAIFNYIAALEVRKNLKITQFNLMMNGVRKNEYLC